MAVVDKKLAHGTLGDTNATLYTSPSGAGAYTIIKAVTLCNTTAGSVSLTLKFDGIEVMATYALGPYATVSIPFIDQIIEAGELIEGSASAAASINYYISGKQVS